MNLANAISIARLLSVPLIVWLMLKHQWTAAFGVFIAAGVSDAIDGLLARRFGMMTELGSYLDPLADKALLVAIYVVMGLMGQLPEWLVILVVSRDIMIVGGTVLSAVIGLPLSIRPLLVSKLNTGAQIGLAAGVLAHLAFGWFPDLWIDLLVLLVAATTIVSGGGYIVQWWRRQGSKEAS